MRPILEKTPYELWRNRKPIISYFHSFGCICYMLNTKDQIGKFYSKVDKGTFLDYLKKSKVYKAYNSRTLIVEETINVKFEDVSQTGMKQLDLGDEFSDFHLTKPIEKRKVVDPSIDSIRGSDESEATKKRTYQTKDLWCHPTQDRSLRRNGNMFPFTHMNKF